MAAQDPLEEETSPIPEAEYQKDPYKGVRICNNIDGQKFFGNVEGIEVGQITKEKVYRIRYDDNDLEHFTLEQLLECKLDEPKKMKRPAAAVVAENAQAETPKKKRGKKDEVAESASAAAPPKAAELEAEVVAKKPAAADEAVETPDEEVEEAEDAEDEEAADEDEEEDEEEEKEEAEEEEGVSKKPAAAVKRPAAAEPEEEEEIESKPAAVAKRPAGAKAEEAEDEDEDEDDDEEEEEEAEKKPPDEGDTNEVEDLSQFPKAVVKRAREYRFCHGVCQRIKHRVHFAKRLGVNNPCHGVKGEVLSKSQLVALVKQMMEEEGDDGEAKKKARVEKQRREALAKEREGTAVPEQQPSGTVDQDQCEQGEYIFDFGMHTGKKLSEVRSKHPDYIATIIVSNQLQRSHTANFKAALQKEGTLQQEIDNAKTFQTKKAERKVAQAAKTQEADTDVVLAEVPKLRSEKETARLAKLEAADAEAFLKNDIVPAPPKPVGERRSTKRTRQGASKQVVALNQCMKCGSLDGHNRRTCPLLTDAEKEQIEKLERAEYELLRMRNRSKQRLRAHLEYTKPRQRSTMYETRPDQRKRAPLHLDCTQKQLLRLPALEFALHLIQIKLLEKLRGKPCPLLAQNKCFKKGFGNLSILGAVSGPKDPPSQDIFKTTVHYRCVRCREVFPVDYKNPLFELKGGGRTSVTDVYVCLYNAVEGADQTYSIRWLGLGETNVATLYRRGRKIQLNIGILLFCDRLQGGRHCFYNLGLQTNKFPYWVAAWWDGSSHYRLAQLRFPGGEYRCWWRAEDLPDNVFAEFVAMNSIAP
mmetsp:Transcript_75948/g.118679  ORF Transcript_75948/g.118679 Transcript_75948/m.118679 type:complete len:813 (+) Transcript_75948:62-2500(+)